MLISSPCDLLIIEDEKDLADLYSDFLEAFGLNFRIETDPRKALEVIENLKPSVVVVDQQMPHLTGIQFLEKVTQVSTMKPIVFMATAWDNIDFAKAYEYWVSAILIKPFRFEAFAKLIRDAIQQNANFHTRRWYRILPTVEAEIEGYGAVGKIENLSCGGAAFKNVSLSRDLDSPVVIKLKWNDEVIKLPAAKSWNRGDRFGFEFLNLEPATRARLLNLISYHALNLPTC
jgi:DNA-binding NtrC family response regulator